MADEKTGTGSPAQDDSNKNLKEEFNRKFDNVSNQVKTLQQTNTQLLQELQKMAKNTSAPKASQDSSQGKDIDQVWYDNPKEAARRIREETKQEIMSELSQSNAIQSKTTSTLNQLVNEFPELSDSDSELTKLAVKNYNDYSDEDKVSPLAYKAAVKDAAMELGMKPKSKRSDEENESFSLRGSNSSSSQRSKRKGQIDPGVAAFAAAVGVDLSKPEVKERVANNHGRKSYTKWE